jgi:hypothetical protein
MWRQEDGAKFCLGFMFVLLLHAGKVIAIFLLLLWHSVLAAKAGKNIFGEGNCTLHFCNFSLFMFIYMCVCFCSYAPPPKNKPNVPLLA